MKKTLLTTLFIIAACVAARGQKFVWNVNLESQFDNREYNSPYNWSQTLFGVRGTPEIGLGWLDNAVKVGATGIVEFGSRSFERRPEMVLYYNYNTDRFNISGGIFPRNQTIGRYSTAFFSDSVRFYDPNISGLLAQIYGRVGYFEFACDWDSRQTDTRREKFTLFSAAEARCGVMFAGYNFSMHHHAGTATGGWVTDNVWLYPYLGVNLNSLVPMQELWIQAGWLLTAQNDRNFVGKYVTPGGAQIELTAQKWGLGVYNTTYIGKDLMPYYSSYGAGLYWGDSFYATRNGMYNRLELYWSPLRRRDMDLRVSSVHHYDGKTWSWQQMVTFGVFLDRKMFDRKGNFRQ